MADPVDVGTPLLSSVDSRIEAALFAAGRPVRESEIAELLPAGVDVPGALARISGFWAGRGIVVRRSSEGWAMLPERSILPERRADPVRALSEAAIATLAAVAMHQPITVTGIERVRGVKLARGILESLEGAGLVSKSGENRRGTGRAPYYVVTETFLERFGVDSLADLPTSEEALLELGISEGTTARGS